MAQKRTIDEVFTQIIYGDYEEIIISLEEFYEFDLEKVLEDNFDGKYNAFDIVFYFAENKVQLLQLFPPKYIQENLARKDFITACICELNERQMFPMIQFMLQLGAKVTDQSMEEAQFFAYPEIRDYLMQIFSEHMMKTLAID